MKNIKIGNKRTRPSGLKMVNPSKNKGDRTKIFKTRKTTPANSINKSKFGDKVSSFEKTDKEDIIRLNKYIAAAGICSRREADEYIKLGLVEVNGKIITELGSKVSKTDLVKVDNKQIKGERKVYILLNKPKDFITTTDDPFAKRTVMDLLKNACKERIYPVGRLDRASTGVLLLTNDGELTKKLTHPKHNKKKIYQLSLDKKLTREDMDKLTDGIELDDGIASIDEISFIDPTDKKQIGVEIHSGKNRILRRMFEFLGYKVLKLDRVYFAGLTKKGLPRGHWRFLTDKEIAMIRMGAYE